MSSKRRRDRDWDGRLVRWRRRLWIVAAVSVVVGAMGCRAGRESSTFDQAWIEISVDGTMRRALVCKPAATTSDSLLPLVIVFHGIGDSAEAMNRESHFGALAAKGEAIVAFPETLRNAWLVSPDLSAFAQSSDVKFVHALIEELQAGMPVDSKRVYGFGVSNGATFVEAVSITDPSVFTAVAAYAGGLPEFDDPIPHASHSPPLLLLAGDRDETGAIEAVRSAAEQLDARNYPVTLEILTGESHRWNPARNGIIRDFFLGERRARTETMD